MKKTSLLSPLCRNLAELEKKAALWDHFKSILKDETGEFTALGVEVVNLLFRNNYSTVQIAKQFETTAKHIRTVILLKKSS